jgi:hypothetical protein
MNLLADEGLERVVVERLRRDGHSVEWVAELAPSLPDEEVLRLAAAGGAVLVTEDKDFGELVEGLPNAVKAAVVAEAMRAYGKDMAGASSVVSPDSVRVRRPSGDPEPAAV